jgi:hypothetical protein
MRSAWQWWSVQVQPDGSSIQLTAWIAASVAVLAAGGLYINDILNAQESIPQRYDLPKLKGRHTLPLLSPSYPC